MSTLQSSPRSFLIKSPTYEQLWSCFQRYLYFEDPVCRWQRLVKLLGRYVKIPFFKTRDLCMQPLAIQESLFELVWGLANWQQTSNNSSLLFSVVLALEDLVRFQPALYGSWFLSLPQQVSHKNLVPVSLAVKPDPRLKDFAYKKQFSYAQTAWLEHARRTAMNWLLLTEAGPWAADSRARFLALYLHELSKLSRDSSAVDYFCAQDIFRQLLKSWRNRLPGSFLPELILVVEGSTEALLLSHFSKLLGLDFEELGVMVIVAGGSKQLYKRYSDLKKATTLSIVAIVDRDAHEVRKLIKEVLREHDRLCYWNQGEIEDTFASEVLVAYLNKHLHSLGVTDYVNISDFTDNCGRVTTLDCLWRQRGLGNFDKIGFAKSITRNFTDVSNIPAEIVTVIKSIGNLVRQRI